MADIELHLDRTGWFPVDGLVIVSPLTGRPVTSTGRWQNVTSDEMVLALVTDAPWDATAEIAVVRETFRNLLVPLHAALVTCDQVTCGDVPVLRCMAKYRPTEGNAMRYVAALSLPLEGARRVELSISAVERGLTGVREAIITREMMRRATISEREQLGKGAIPIEWKFERYRPGTRGEVAYLLSDDERYDAEFPDHPLSRVRRLLRRIEKTLRISVGASTSPGASIRLQQPEVRPMGKDEMIRELGFQAFMDAVAMESMGRLSQLEVPLAYRQKVSDDRMAAAAKKQFDDSKDRQIPTSAPWSRQEAAEAMVGIYDSLLLRCGESSEPLMRDHAAAARVNRERIRASLTRSLPPT